MPRKKSTQDAPATKPQEKTIELELDNRGIPVWKREDGTVIKELQRPMFFEHAVEGTTRKECRKEFIAFAIECKKLKLISFQEKVSGIENDIKNYQQELIDIDHEPTPQEKLQREMERLQKLLEAKQAALAALD